MREGDEGKKVIMERNRLCAGCRHRSNNFYVEFKKASSLGKIGNGNLNYVAPFHVICTNSIVCSDLPAGRAMRGSYFSRGKSFFSSPICPDQLWGLSTILFIDYQGSLSWDKVAGFSS
jgi:hypothetical protein